MLSTFPPSYSYITLQLSALQIPRGMKSTIKIKDISQTIQIHDYALWPFHVQILVNGVLFSALHIISNNFAELI